MIPRRVDDGWQTPVDPDWPGFAGHFPGLPILPAAELLAAAMRCVADGGGTTTVLRSARFRRPVAPGDHLRWHAVPDARGWRVHAERDGERICEFAFAECGPDPVQRG